MENTVDTAVGHAAVTGILATERHRRLMAMVRSHGTVRVSAAAHELGVSESTVRRDLAELRGRGLVVRVHGGAAATGHAPVRAVDRADDAKRAIAAAAAELVRDGMTIMLLSGSTVAAMVPWLAPRHGLTIVTNNLDIAHALAHSSIDHDVVVLGGMVHREQMTLIGTIAEQNLRSVHVDLMFGGTWGLDGKLGATGTKILLAGRRHELLDHADEVVILADSTKFGRTGAAQLAAPDQITRVITDAAASKDHVAALRAAGVDVQVCRPLAG